MSFGYYHKDFQSYAHTTVFWNLDDFPLPADYDEYLLIRRIRSAIRRYDSLHNLRIHAYGETPFSELHVGYSYRGRQITYYPNQEDKRASQTRMLLEMIQLIHINKIQKLFKKLSFLIISKGFPQVLVPYIEDLKFFYGVEIYIAVPDGCVLEDEALLNTASLVWEWNTLIAGGFAKMALPYDPSFTMVEDQEHDASAAAAIVAVDLISKARLKHKLDSVYTEYSSQYLLDFACPRKKKKKNKKGGRKNKGGKNPKLTVNDCLKFALGKGLPKAEDWPHPHLGYLSSSYKPFLVCMEGIELVDCVPVTKLGGGIEFGGVECRLKGRSVKVDTGSGGGVSVYKLRGNITLQTDADFDKLGIKDY